MKLFNLDTIQGHIGLALVVMALALISSCNSRDSSSDPAYIKEAIKETTRDFPEAEFYVDKFYRDLAAFGIKPLRPSISIVKLANLDQVEGLTHSYGISLGAADDSRIEIYINERTWYNMSRSQRYFIMYHELAHDVLNLKDIYEGSMSEVGLMYGKIDLHNHLYMDDFIDAFKLTFSKL